jgi:hypothetical protein
MLAMAAKMVPAGHAAETLCQVAETYQKACKAL